MVLHRVLVERRGRGLTPLASRPDTLTAVANALGAATLGQNVFLVLPPEAMA